MVNRKLLTNFVLSTTVKVLSAHFRQSFLAKLACSLATILTSLSGERRQAHGGRIARQKKASFSRSTPKHNACSGGFGGAHGSILHPGEHNSTNERPRNQSVILKEILHNQ